METILKRPEEILCQQDEELKTEDQKKTSPQKDNDNIYFIAKGKCKVTIKDKFNDRYEEYQVRILHS